MTDERNNPPLQVAEIFEINLYELFEAVSKFTNTANCDMEKAIAALLLCGAPCKRHNLIVTDALERLMPYFNDGFTACGAACAVRREFI